MRTLTLSSEVDFGKGVSVALGMFDGVHMGHRRIITAAKNKSTELGIPSSVLLFSSSPKGAPMLLSLEERLFKIKELGIDVAFIYDFEEISNLSPEEFIKEELSKRLSVRAAFAGFNYRFGKGAFGDANSLTSLCDSEGIFCEIIDEVDFFGESVSSSHIRKLLSQGDVEKANKLLTYPYFVCGEVVHGKELGRTIGLPTVNLTLEKERVKMAFGIYYTKTVIDGAAYVSVTNIGVRPTVEDTDNVNLETHILDFSGDLYGKKIKVEFYGRGREEMRFESVDALKEAVMTDCQRAVEFFKN